MMATTNRPPPTEEQMEAVEHLARCDKMVQTLGGYAGVGKTTVIRELLDRLPGWVVCAYTGKAAQVLRKKGMDSASTIHSLIYRPSDRKRADGGVQFDKVPDHELFVSGFVVDEASMVGKQVYEDLLSFDLPCIFVGDHGQLEPVGSDGFNLMQKPDVTLEKIHRNAGVIARFAEHLRFGRDPREWGVGIHDEQIINVDGQGGEVSLITGDQLGMIDMRATDQIICAYNRTRTALNATVRRFLGLPEGQPVAGDRVMCLQNDREHGVFNGMQGTLAYIDKDWLTFEFDNRLIGPVRYHPEAFGSQKTPERRYWHEDGKRKLLIPFDWAYAVTAHKFQGDEADNVLVLEQRCDLWQHSRWCYTAASRAKKRLTWVLGD